MKKIIACAVISMLYVLCAHTATAAETPPHGGVLLEMGEEQGHLELIHDSKSGKLTLYVLDGKARNSVMIKGTPKVELKTDSGVKEIAAKASDEKGGKASQFECADEALKISKLKGKISLVYKDKPYELDMEKVDEN